MDSSGVDAFLQHGGRITKVASTVPATEREILDFMTSVGSPVRCLLGEAKPYVHERRRYSIEGIVRLANHYRSRDGLPPFAFRP